MQFNLERFTDEHRRDFTKALNEIKSGKKKSHWMWYIFPQMKGLGFSDTARFYGITGLAEARQFLNDPYLGGNLLTITAELLMLEGNDAHSIFGSPDDLKLRSSMTLFKNAAAEGQDIFSDVLVKFFDGQEDARTLELIDQ